MPFLDLKKQLAQAIAQHFNHPEITAPALEVDFSAPPAIEMGHVALPCFRFAKLLRKGVDKIAAELSTAPLLPGVTGRPTGPYVNFRLSPEKLAAQTLGRIAAEGERFGS